jgi:hypothetical protein
MKILHSLPYAPSSMHGRTQNNHPARPQKQPEKAQPLEATGDVKTSLSKSAAILMDRGEVSRLWDSNEARQRVLLAQSQLLTRAEEAVSIQANLNHETALRLLS